MGQEQLACPLTKGERILVALDGSKYGDAALEQAISLGRTCNSTIFAVSVVDLFPEQMQVAHALGEKLTTEARQTLDQAKARVEQENIPCETILHMGGQPHEFIVEEAKERNADLIVMGTHGRTGLRRLLMGSVVQKVIGHAPCSVMVVPTLE
ncbi:universal stress protein [Thermodesulfobacteriota bacterium]